MAHRRRGGIIPRACYHPAPSGRARRGPPENRSASPMTLHGRIFTGMTAGAGLGLAANVLCDRLGRSADLEAFITGVTQPAGQIFLRLIFMVVIPLIVAAL